MAFENGSGRQAIPPTRMPREIGASGNDGAIPYGEPRPRPVEADPRGLRDDHKDLLMRLTDPVIQIKENLRKLTHREMREFVQSFGRHLPNGEQKDFVMTKLADAFSDFGHGLDDDVESEPTDEPQEAA